MKNFLLLILCSVCVSLVGSAYGHAGHDHGHWSANVLHWGFYISMALMVFAVMYGMVKLLTVKAESGKLQSKGGNHAA
jgi:O-antigen ligase